MSAALFGSLLALPVSAATFDFTTYADGAQEVLTQSVPGLSVSVSAGTYTFDNQGFLGSFNTDQDGFFGVGDLAVSTQDGSGFLSGDAGIGVVLASLPGLGPNIGGPGDLLTFTFDKMVRFDDVTFGNINFNDDVDVFVDGLLVTADDPITGASPYDLSGLKGTQISFGADGILGGFDNFNVQALSATVPLPAGAILLITGLGGLFAARRRKTS
jgi:hypothetical protein